MKGSGVPVGNFELNLLGRPTWAWAILLLIPKRDKFQHSWLNKRSMSFCVTTEMWWPVYVEGEGLFCLLCKENTSNSQNKSKVFNKEPCKRFRPEEFEDRCRMSQHMNAVSAEMLRRVSVFQRTLDEREIVTEDVLLKVFTAAYWIMKKSYLTTRSSYM